MRRALTLIVILTVLSVGPGVWLDVLQRNTARQYKRSFEEVRQAVIAGFPQQARQEQTYLHALWQRDALWLNCLISHHHTRAVNTALLKLDTALEMNWNQEALQALDELYDALGDIESSDFMSLENVL